MLEGLGSSDKCCRDIDIGADKDSSRLPAGTDVDKLGSWCKSDLVQRSHICHDMAAPS